MDDKNLKQSHALMSAIATNIPWDKVNQDKAQEFIRSRKTGMLMAWAINKGVVGLAQTITPSDIFGQGCRIEPVAKMNRAPVPFNFDKVRFSSGLNLLGGSKVTDKKHVDRLAELGVSCLGFEHFLFCWAQCERLPREWIETENGQQRYISFSADSLYGPGEDTEPSRVIMTHQSGEWIFYLVLRSHGFDRQVVSAYVTD